MRRNVRYSKPLFCILALLFSSFLPVRAQEGLTLLECRRLAIENNKELMRARENVEVAKNNRYAAETNYLPKVQAIGGYVHTGREISILNRDQKRTLNNLGSSFVEGVSTPLQSAEAQAILAQYPDLLPLVQQLEGQLGTVGTALNGFGHNVVDAFRTDSRNITFGAILLTQPLYMGGKIRAYDNITRYQKELADWEYSVEYQNLQLEVDRAYWQVVSLANKLTLAKKFRSTLQKLDDDVQAMIREGVATKANELQVAVKLNEAEMMVTKVEDGLALSRMLLAQLTGIPYAGSEELSAKLRLADEQRFTIPVDTAYVLTSDSLAQAQRPELQQLRLAQNIYREKANIERAAYLPQAALLGGFMLSNPNGFNGFQNRFAGTWSVGLTVKMPLWSWHEGRYKIRAAQAEARMAEYRAEEVAEKITLQVSQETFRVNEAAKRLRLTAKNLEQADENLRIANLGYQEGVIVLSDVLQAQTAWLQAHSDQIDAQVDVMITRASLDKALGNTSLPAPTVAQDEQEPNGKVLKFMKKVIQ